MTPQFIGSMSRDNHLKEAVRIVIDAIDARDRYEPDLCDELVARVGPPSGRVRRADGRGRQGADMTDYPQLAECGAVGHQRPVRLKTARGPVRLADRLQDEWDAAPLPSLDRAPVRPAMPDGMLVLLAAQLRRLTTQSRVTSSSVRRLGVGGGLAVDAVGLAPRRLPGRAARHG